MPSVHIPVLTDPIIEWLAPTAPGLLVDATLGLGGHAAALLSAAPGFQLLGVDRDPEAVAEARRRLEPYDRRFTTVTETFDRIPELLAELKLEPPAAILADLGCSSLQLDSAESRLPPMGPSTCAWGLMVPLRPSWSTQPTRWS